MAAETYDACFPDLDDRHAAAAFRQLVAHLAARTDVQNIDLMHLAGFCRNCLAEWYQRAANAAGEPLDKMAARALIYRMPFETWKAQFQK